MKVLATDPDIELTLFASSENIKDHLFPTTVSAVLGAKLKLAITNDQVTRQMRRPMACAASPALVSLLTGAVLLSLAAQSGGAVQAAAPPAEEACARQRDDALAVAGGATGAETRSLVRRIHNAFALFRFHRVKAAQAQLDGAVRQLESRPDLFRSRAERIAKALEAMRSCVSSTRAPGVATVSVRVFRLDGGSLDALGARGGAGVYVRVEGIPVGRTTAGGTLRAQIPSGPVAVTAVVPSTAEGVQPVTIEPGGSRSVSVGLDADGDVFEETDVAVSEAVNGVLHAKAPSLTLRFTDGDRLLRVVSGAEVELLDSSDVVQQNLSPLFTIKAGAIVARDVRTVLAAVRPLHNERTTTVRLQVRGVDADGFTHGNVVDFRVQWEQSRTPSLF